MTRNALRVGGVNADRHNPTEDRLRVVGGPCHGQTVRNLPGNPRRAVLCRPGEVGRWHDYLWTEGAYVYVGSGPPWA
jgi:hypothetical protein